ncbi:MAG TPA: hypothetical protein VFI08_08920 [Spirochaetia bacterium]|nr:hypothetical protein [Spirochaetia bacterium]
MESRREPVFDFLGIRRHWESLSDRAAAARYLDDTEQRLRRWLQGLGPWIDFDFAVRRLEKDLGLWQVKSHLTWLAYRHRLRLATEEKRRIERDPEWQDAELRVQVELSADGQHDAVWHEDFRGLYLKAMERERRELERLRETGALPADPGPGAVSRRPARLSRRTRTPPGSGPRDR